MFDWLNKNSSSSEQTERTRLTSLSEKELMIEMILELKRISRKCDEIGRKIVIWSNQNHKNLSRGNQRKRLRREEKNLFPKPFFSAIIFVCVHRLWSNMWSKVFESVLRAVVQSKINPFTVRYTQKQNKNSAENCTFSTEFLV